MIDLHSHTTASDGQHPPAEQVALAARAGVTVLSITDHDTTGGLAEAATAAAALQVRLVNGIEISIIHNRREVHILGHFIDPTHAALQTHALALKAERDGRMEEMISRLNRAGIPVTLEQVRQLAGNAPLARPHLARALVELNLCSSVKEAFDRWLGDGKLAHVMRRELTIEAAVQIIHQAGGTATLAHPGSSKVNPLELRQFAAAGLDGLEVGHLDHPPSLQEKLRALARELNLVCTAGSDFHGKKVAPTREFGQVTMQPVELAALEARAVTSRAPAGR